MNMDCVYKVTPVAVRERAGKVVATVKPALCAAAKTDQARELKDSGWEIYSAALACIVAFWAFFEPAIANVVKDAIACLSKRQEKAKGGEKLIFGVASSAIMAAQPVAVTVNEKALAYGGVPKVAAEKVQVAANWVKTIADGSVDAQVLKEGSTRARSAISTPRSSLCSALKSNEFARVRKAAYAVFLAMLACATALVMYVIPMAEESVAWAVSTFNTRCSKASGAEVFALRLAHAMWSTIERTASTGKQLAEKYTGPGNLTLLQLATAFTMLVQWLKESATKPTKVVVEIINAPNTESVSSEDTTSASAEAVLEDQKTK